MKKQTPTKNTPAVETLSTRDLKKVTGGSSNTTTGGVRLPGEIDFTPPWGVIGG